VMGVAAVLEEKGHVVPPFEVAIATDVPLGGGVSSSAALEVASVAFFSALLDITIAPLDRALYAQACEHRYVGLPCGIMDQLISSMARPSTALLIDCRAVETGGGIDPVPLDDPNTCIVVTNSCVKHELTGSEYTVRKESCGKVAETMGVPALRDADMAGLEKVREKLGDTDFARARHVITENARTLTAAEALKERDYDAFGKLMVESHNSLRDDYEVSVPEIDFLVETAMAVKGVYGSRITGGGFGGCTVTICKADAVDALMAMLDSSFQAKFNVKPDCFVTVAGDGARVEKL